MKLLLAFFLLLVPLMGLGQDIVLDTYECALSLPAGEGWQRGYAQKLPEGEMIFSATRPESRQVFAVSLLPDMPSTDITNPGIVARVLETLGALGYKPGTPAFIDWKGQKCVQIFARRDEAAARDFICVVRAVMRGRNIFVVMTVGRGDEDRVKDPLFMRVVESFRFLEAPAHTYSVYSSPFFSLYRISAYTCGGAAVVLVAIFIVIMTTVKRRSHR